MDTRRTVVAINEMQRMIAHAMDDKKQRDRHYLDDACQWMLARITQSRTLERPECASRPANR